MFQKFSRWLSVNFVCMRCGRNVFLMSFGFGTTLCPECYNGKQPVIFFDDRYWLNRILSRNIKMDLINKEPEPIDDVLLGITNQVMETESQN